MTEPRNDMLPDKGATSGPDVKGTTDSEVVKTPPQEEKPMGNEAPQPVPDQPVTDTPKEKPKEIKTPDNQLYAALAEERKLRKEAERERDQLKSSPAPTEEPPETDTSEFVTRDEFNELKENQKMGEVLAKYPQIVDKWDEFEEYKEDPENKGMKLMTVAKAFVTEKGLTEATTKRVGLEKPTGGDKTPTPKLTEADVKRLRETQPRKYEKLIKSGELKPGDIQ
jgi:hypothetical protein|tara:strand:+ start:1286 stop:1957 length:672 start_codon:yes stop_codon:yes gene_type:complete